MHSFHPRPVRRPHRFYGHDYSIPDAFFVTVVTAGRQCTLGQVQGQSVELSERGQVVWDAWRGLHVRSAWIRLDSFVVMPNHAHGILEILEEPRTDATCAGPRPSLSDVMGVFKSLSTREANRRRRTPGIALWQRGFHDRIIRDGRELESVRAYIADNPRSWTEDRLFPIARR
jgi:REP element-mobilizing transposase RayT